MCDFPCIPYNKTYNFSGDTKIYSSFRQNVLIKKDQYKNVFVEDALEPPCNKKKQ